MRVEKQRAIREGHKKEISQQLEKIEQAKQTSIAEFSTILDAITLKLDCVKALNEKILEQTELDDIEKEIIQAEAYRLELEIKLRNLKDFMQNHGSTADQIPPQAFRDIGDYQTEDDHTAMPRLVPSEMPQQTVSTSSYASQFH